MAADANRLATTFSDPRDDRARAGSGIVLIRRADSDASLVHGVDVIKRTSEDDLGNDINRGVRTISPVTVTVTVTVAVAVAVAEIRIAGTPRNRGPCRIHGQRCHC